ncbi:Sialidase precursor [Novipirellula aureliae]|uniref:exo-alpha-sialidase n=2 Tax=Novipirellula aureliae TaxID=2527966 RepID=A0A5C6DK45_9BACT|nr:Sialidase precursor [Novipirellula aureliae]
MNPKCMQTRSLIVFMLLMPYGTSNADDRATTAYSGDAIFVAGEDGYDTYRIPALAVTNRGTVLAICEGRVNASSDAGDIDLVIKRSTDSGETWSDLNVIWSDERNTCGNPCTVVDRDTGTIWLLSTWNHGSDHERQIINQQSKDTRRVFVLASQDDGLTWSEPQQITDNVKLEDWTWYATGPGSGIQIQQGPHQGRLVIPCDHIEADSKRYYSHAIFSDDHGQTWQLGDSTPNHRVNECQVVEIAGGRLMLNMRNYDRSQKSRQIAFSDNGGETWKDQTFDTTLVDPICQAAIERFCFEKGESESVLLFSNPASTSSRTKMTLRASYDSGKTWTGQRVLFAAAAAYSDLAVLPNGTIACFHEAGQKNAYESIRFTKIKLSQLTASPEVSDDK